MGGSSTDSGTAVAVDAGGNVVVAGRTRSSIEGRPIASGEAGFIAIYSSQGQRLWLELLGQFSSSSDQVLSVVVDRGSGAVYTAGFGALVSTQVDLFLARLVATQSFVCPGGIVADLATGLCANVNECVLFLHNCPALATCVDTPGSFACVCATGYAGPNCSDVNECTALGNGGCAQTCSNTAGSFTCGCEAGFTQLGPLCDPDECQLGNSTCRAGTSLCVNTAGSFACACNGTASPAGDAGCAAFLPNAGLLQWVRQLGSAAGSDDDARVAVDRSLRRGVALVGSVGGSVDSNVWAGGRDVLVGMYSVDTGRRLWSSMVGTAADDFAHGVALDDAANVIWAGRSFGQLDGQPNAGCSSSCSSSDAAYSGWQRTGSRDWTRLFGSAVTDVARAIAADRRNGPSSGETDFYMVGETSGVLPGASGSLGSTDAFLVRLSGGLGTRVWIRQFGTIGSDSAQAVAVFQSEIYVTGYTTGSMAGAANVFGNTDIFIAKFTAQGEAAWTTQFGTAGSETGYGIAVDGSGVYVTGAVGGSLGGQPFAGGGSDLFVTKHTLAGAWLWTRMLGSNQGDLGLAIALDAASGVIVAGSAGAAIAGEPSAGRIDALLAMFTSDGALRWTRLVGTNATDQGLSVAVDDSGAAYLAGTTEGAMPGQRGSGTRDLFLAKFH